MTTPAHWPISPPRPWHNRHLSFPERATFILGYYTGLELSIVTVRKGWRRGAAAGDDGIDDIRLGLGPAWQGHGCRLVL